MTDWNIRKRSACCARTGHEFADGEAFYTLLFRQDDGWERVDLCTEAWQSYGSEEPPFSFWQSIYEAPPPAQPDSLPKENAESLLRKYLDDDDPRHANVRYLLAVMLERKKILRHTDTRQLDSGSLLIYEHLSSGEVFLIPDPDLRLEKISEVQEEVAGLLGQPQTAGDPTTVKQEQTSA